MYTIIWNVYYHNGNSSILAQTIYAEEEVERCNLNTVNRVYMG